MKTLLFSLIFIFGLTAQAQTVTASFNYSLGPFGQVYFNSTSTNVGTNEHKWLFGDGTIGGNSSSITHTYAAPGSYNVVLIIQTSSGIVRDSTTRKVTLPTTIGLSKQSSTGIQLFPNPTTSLLNIEGDNLTTICAIRVLNSNGQLVAIYSPNDLLTNHQQINTSSWLPSLYWVVVDYGNGHTSSQRVVKLPE